MKEVKSIQHYLAADHHETVLVFADDSSKRIFVTAGMIFICDCDWQQLNDRVKAEDFESFEAFDTVDSSRYYADHELADYIDCAVFNAVYRLFCR